ncbi:MAG: hypothetical protein P8X77_09720 [Maritimibacter sp.]
MHGTRISLHLGALCTDDDLLVSSLRWNTSALSEIGIEIPKPNRYRPLLRQIFERLDGRAANQDTQDVLFEQLTNEEELERLYLSHPFLLANHPGAFCNGMLYPNAGERSAAIRNLFPDNPVDFVISVRDPATWIPALFSHQNPELTFEEFVDKLDPEHLLWSDVIRDIRETNPDIPITVWCNEDSPLIWPELMHEVLGLDQKFELRGSYRVLQKIMHKEGIKRLRSYLGTHPPVNEIQRRRIVAAFLDKYALTDEIEEEYDLPGWTPELIDQLSAIYDDDMMEIARIPGVNLITP